MNAMQSSIHEKAVSIARKFKSAEKDILEILLKVEAHEVFRARRCPSLYEYAVGEMGLSPDQAWTYIKIARASKESAELKDAFHKEEISVSNARVVATLFTHKEAKLDEERKAQILEKAKSATNRELRKELAQEFPMAGLREEKTRYVTSDRVEFRFSVAEIAARVFERVRELESEKAGRKVTIEEAFNQMGLFYLEKNDPLKKAERAMERKNKVTEKEKIEKKVNQQKNKLSTRKSDSLEAKTFPSIISITPEGAHEFKFHERKAIPREVEHEIWIRDQGKCQHPLEAGGRCGATLFVEVHHLQEVSQGGSNEKDNLVLLCRAHHRLIHYDRSTRYVTKATTTVSEAVS